MEIPWDPGSRDPGIQPNIETKKLEQNFAKNKEKQKSKEIPLGSHGIPGSHGIRPGPVIIMVRIYS